MKLLERSDEWQEDYTGSPKSFQLYSLVPSLEKQLCVCVSGMGTNGLQVEVSLPKVNRVVMKKLEMLFTCLSITNPNKLMSQIKQSMAAIPDKFGNPRISTVFPTELCCSVCSHQVPTARFWEQVPSGWT